MTPIYEARRDPYAISTDPSLLEIEIIHSYLTHSYWSPGMPLDVVVEAIRHSFAFGLYHMSDQVGFGRVVTDYATFAYLADVFVLSEHRGKGLGVWLVDTITGCPALDGIRTFLLATRDAHGLYRKFGFEVVPETGRLMAARRDMPWYRPDLVHEPARSSTNVH